MVLARHVRTWAARSCWILLFARRSLSLSKVLRCAREAPYASCTASDARFLNSHAMAAASALYSSLARDCALYSCIASCATARSATLAARSCSACAARSSRFTRLKSIRSRRSVSFFSSAYDIRDWHRARRRGGTSDR